MTKAQILAFIQDEDIPYEEDIQKNPYSIKIWIRYIDSKRLSIERAKHVDNESFEEDIQWFPLWSLYERALKLFPGSYKLWKSYLDYRLLRAAKFTRNTEQQNHSLIDQTSSQMLYGLWERALLTQSRAPRMWISYLECLMVSITQPTNDNRVDPQFFLWVFNRALRALPISQHHRIWPLGLSLAEKTECSPLVSATIFARYAAIDSESIDKLILLLDAKGLPEAALKAIVSKRLNVKEQGQFVDGEASAAYLHRLVELAVRVPNMKSGELESIVLAGISDGRLAQDAGWALATLSAHLLQRPEPNTQELARDILVSAIDGRKGTLIRTARDFGLVFDALAKLEEMAISRLLRQLSKKKRDSQLLRQEADWRLARFERLMAQREWLLSGVLVRASPSDVGLWLKRIALGSASDPTKRTELFTEAIDSIKKGSPGLSKLWLTFAKETTMPEERRKIFERALENGPDYFGSSEEISVMWLAYATEVGNAPIGNDEAALEVLQKATAIHPRILALWTAVIEMEIKLDQPFRVRCAFERILELRIATPATIFSYISFLESEKAHALLEGGSKSKVANTETNVDPALSNDNYQESKDAAIFSIYERAIAAFGFPAAMDLWSAYLFRFETMLKNQKPCPWRLVERGRELYEQAVRGAPSSRTFWIAYAGFEERFGQPKASLAVLRKGISAMESSSTTSKDDLVDLWMVLLAKTQHHAGLLASREVYEEAIQSSTSPLPDSAVRDLCLRYAALEASLGEVERARSIYAYGSRLADSRTCGSYWEAWEAFERAHGSQDTFRELLRVKRAVQAQFSIADVQFVPATQENNAGVSGQEHPFSHLTDSH